MLRYAALHVKEAQGRWLGAVRNHTQWTEFGLGVKLFGFQSLLFNLVTS